MTADRRAGAAEEAETLETEGATVVPLPLPDPAPNQPPPRPPQRTSSSLLMAAMLGLADGMGFERPRTELVAVADAEPGEGALIIGFGPLDPLD